jgi:hypothetical protein
MPVPAATKISVVKNGEGQGNSEECNNFHPGSIVTSKIARIYSKLHCNNSNSNNEL